VGQARLLLARASQGVVAVDETHDQPLHGDVPTGKKGSRGTGKTFALEGGCRCCFSEVLPLPDMSRLPATATVLPFTPKHPATTRKPAAKARGRPETDNPPRVALGGDKEALGLYGKSFTRLCFIPKHPEAEGAQRRGDGEGKNLQCFYGDVAGIFIL
jgi:hypothetical protein